MPGQGQALSLLETILLSCYEHSRPRFLVESPLIETGEATDVTAS
jgi:hypothetical protein